MLTASVLALTLLSGQTWTVSNDARADFSEIEDAIDDERVALGDILLVSPGEYDGFTLDRKLTIVGQSGASRPVVTDPVTVMASMKKGLLESGGDFSFGFIEFREGVTVVGGNAPGQFDNCTFFGDDDHPTALRIENAAEVMLSRCVLVGVDAEADDGFLGFKPAGHALEAISSNVIFVDSQATGGHGAVGPRLPPHPGGSGLRLEGGSKVMMAGGQMLGGQAGGSASPCNLGPAGHGIWLVDSMADLRGFGANDDVVLPPLAACGPPAFSVFATGESSKIRLGGPIGLRGIQAPNGALEVTNLLQPYLQNVGDATPGSSNVLQLRGEPNRYAVFFGSLDPESTFVFEVDQPVGFDPYNLFFVAALVTSNQPLAPVECPYDVPVNEPILLGLTARFQCVMQDQPAQGMPTKATASNPVDVVVRF
ncbi:MAG: hypothetical protein ACF8XB_13355 [Planctomycetota bacterium JB042]